MIAALLDNETSGLVENRSLKLELQPSIVEFYFCLADLKEGKVLEEYQTLIKPPKPISAKITEITTITNEMLESAPPFSEVADEIAKRIESAPLVIAHNLSFDRDVLEIEFERLERKLNWPPVRCTVEATVHLKGYRLSLTKLHELLFKEPFAGAHRAKEDVQALMRCCVELVKRDVL